MTSTAPNADPAELAKFSSLAQSWWEPNGPSKPLHDLNPLRLEYIDRAVSLSGKLILDVGCGGGILSESMARRGARVLGIDLSQAVLEVAELHALEAGVTVEYRTLFRRGARPRAARCVRCGDLHGDARARAGSGRRARSARRTGEARRRCHRVDLESHPSGVRRCDRRGGADRTRSAARHARIPEVHPPLRACALGHGWRASNSRISPASPTIH